LRSSAIPEDGRHARSRAAIRPGTAELRSAAIPEDGRQTLVRVVPVVTRDLPGAPAPDLLRQALRKHLN
jgi:hypothetical protein